MTRKIELQMMHAVVKALRLSRAGHEVKPWKGGNTVVEATATCRVSVHLHGNHIANVVDFGSHYEVAINLCGYNTPTTRSRLSAILRDTIPGCNGVSKRKGHAAVIMTNGATTLIDDNGWYVINSNGVQYP